jgi:galactofuranose transport system substrate-binding protein
MYLDQDRHQRGWLHFCEMKNVGSGIMKQRIKTTCLCLLILVLGAMTSCAGQQNQATPTIVNDKPIVLGFAQVGEESVWRAANTQSIINAAKEAGIDLIFVNAQQSTEKQKEAIRSFIAMQVDVIAFSPNVEDDWDPVLEEAQAAHIPVIIVDRSIKTKDDSLYVTYFGSDMLEEGRKAGTWLVDKLKGVTGDINIAEIRGNEKSDPTVSRSEGFHEIITPYPNMKIVLSESADFMRSKGREVMNTFLESGTKINVLFAHNDDMALGAIKAIEEHGLQPGKDILIVSVDAIKEAFEAMIAGKLNCTVECNPLQGPRLMQIVKDIVAGKTIDKRIVIPESVFPSERAAEELPNRKY